MSWQMAVVGAIGATQVQQQGAIGSYNKAIADRNFRVKVQEAEQIEKQKEFDIAQFDKQYQKLEGETKVSLAKSGVVQGAGTGYRIQLANAIESELQKKIIEYNAKVAADRKIEEANFAIISGQVAKQQSKLAQIGTIASVGTSLLTMSKGTV